MTDAGPRLVDGLVALELGHVEGQLCGRFLADLGMTVVKVEPPGGDPARALRPLAPDGDGPPVERSLPFAFLNAGKQSVVADLDAAEDAETLQDLLTSADVVIFSADLPAALLGRLRARATSSGPAALVVCRLTGFGPTGPYRDYAAPDLVVTAMGGLVFISGEAGAPPCAPPETQGYHLAGLWAAQAILAALWRRARTGEGAFIDVPAHAAVATLDQIVRSFAYDGVELGRAGSQHPRVAPAKVFATCDGFVHLYVSRKHWSRFLASWPDHPVELDDPTWADNDTRRQAADSLNPLVADFAHSHSTADFVALMQRAGVPCLPVNSASDFLDDPHIRERGLLAETTHPWLGDYRQVAAPLLVDGRRPAPGRPPLLGEHGAPAQRQPAGASPP